MAAGLTVYNDNNKIQIDGAYKNLYLSRKIELTGAGSSGGTFADGEVLAAVGGTNSQTIDAICINRPDGWTCVVNSFTSGMCVFVFGTKITAAAHGVGLQVFDENENIVYDSNNKHPVVMAFGHSDGTPYYAAAKPAVAVCVNRHVDYTADQISIQIQQFYEQYQVWHNTEYGWVEKKKFQAVEHPAEYGNYWTAGYYQQQYHAGGYEYNWQTGQYEYTSGYWENVWVPGSYEYGIIKEAYTTYEYVTVKEWDIVSYGHYEYEWGWITYWVTYRTIYYMWREDNFKLLGGSIKTQQVGNGISGQSNPEMMQKQPFINGEGESAVYYSNYKYTSVAVDARSWLLFDVNGL